MARDASGSTAPGLDPAVALIWLGSAWLAGIALGLATADWWRIPLFGGAALAGFAVLYHEQRRSLLLLLLAPLLIGAGAYRADQTRYAPARLPPGPIDAVRGVVADWPVRGGRDTRATVQLSAARAGGVWHDATGQVRFIAPLYPELWRGDHLEATGYFRAREELPWRASLERRDQVGEFRAFQPRIVAAAPRDDLTGRRVALVGRSKETLLRTVPQPQAGLIAGILLGDATLLPKHLRTAFSDSGTSHIMALSGWNIAIVAGLLQLLGQRLGRARSIPWLMLSSALIWTYTTLVGAGPTIVRAAIMGTLYLLASATGRRGDALTALVVAAVAMTAVAPGVLLDIGFQLSCAATAGIVLLSSRLTRALQRVPPLLGEGIAATLAAELFTLPLVAHYFGRASLVALPANLLVEPLVPLVMLGGALTVISSALPLPLAPVLGLVSWLPAWLVSMVVERLGSLPWASATVPPPGWAVVALAYAGLALLVSGSSPRRALLAVRHAYQAVSAPGGDCVLVGFATSGAVLLWLALLAQWLR